MIEVYGVQGCLPSEMVTQHHAAVDPVLTTCTGCGEKKKLISCSTCCCLTCRKCCAGCNSRGDNKA